MSLLGWSALVLLLCLFAEAYSQATTRAQQDKITNLPGLTFDPGFDQYSGYLTASSQHYLHYWLVESQGSPQSDPLILWLNGGPGCSSLGGFFTELGPFHVNSDGQTLYENVYAWNKRANVIFLEAPRGVGFSYGTDGNTTWGDDLTAQDNYLALKDFFNNVFPIYKTRPFYVTGESYGGVYIPTLTWLLIQGLQSNDININFQGIAIGNGILSDRQQFNSLINFNYFHGMFGKSDWDLLRQYCCVNSSTSECDFLGAYYHDPRGPCARQAVHMADRWQEETLSDVYNVYQDCYRLKVSHSATERTLRKIDGRRRWLKKSSSHMSQKFTDNQGQINYASTDQFNAFPCFSDDATQNYLNRADVRAAIHIPATLTKTWTDCTDLRHWQFQYDDMTPVFVNILNSQYYANANFRMLIYNGDVDTVCNFLGDEWFIEALVKSQNISTVAERTDWTYQASADYRSQTGGYVKRFAKNLDQLTVKGSGHFVPQDRPGPALQMLMNFINKSPVYDTLTNIDVTPKPLLPQYAGTAQSPCPRKDADLIVSLPGLTFQPNFKQYSGYLNASANNFLHYWLVESQDNPATDPLILWLNGGPGCSSVGGFMTENGPFHPNQDGATLYENVYSWNKKANVLYLEAPRGVGYSYQTVDNQTWSDDLTAEDNYLALKDFFTNVFPEYATRQFFVTGESYGGVYIPTLAWRLFQGIQSGDISIKFQGVAIGNGVLSERLQLNSVVDFLYYHGIVGKDDWNFLMTNCCANVTDTTDCDFYQYMPTGSDGQPMPQPNPCGMKVLMLGEAYVWGSYNDPYNIYQDCYRTKLTKYAAQRVFPHVRPSKQRFDKWDSKNFVPKQKFADNARQINYGSTDPFNGFPCWSDSATEMYMNRAEVRAALNIPDSVPRWTDCNDHILGAFVRQYLDMSDVMKNIINSPLYEQLQFRILVYNGDVDTVCNFLGDEWFVENIVKDLNISTIAARRAWVYQFSADYQNQTAGYVKRFGKRIDLLTVKGSGHYVPMDRPPQALQMLMNFIWNRPNYDQMTGIDSTPKPILPIFKSLGQCSAPSTQSSTSAATATTTTSPTAAPPGTTTTAPTPAPPATTTTAPTSAPSGTTTTTPTAAPPGTITTTPTAASNGSTTTAPTTPPPTSPNAAIRHINSISNALLSMILVVLIVARQ